MSGSGIDLDAATLEGFRTIGLRLDRDGRFFQGNEPVTHARLHQAMLRWLDKREDGRDIIRMDDSRYAYVDVEDAHLRAVTAQWRDGTCFITWDDGTVEPLDVAHLTVAADGALYTVARGNLRGRISGRAHQIFMGTGSSLLTDRNLS